MEANKKETEALFECYRRLYKASTPSADFDKLMDDAVVNDQGKKEIDYMSYEIDKELFDDILNGVIKEYKIKPSYRAKSLKNAIYLGASPKFK